MRRLAGVLVAALGGLTVLTGAVLAVAVGPDDRLATGPHRLTSDGPVITTAPEAIGYSGPRVEIDVRSVDPARNLFAGVGHHVDVHDLLAGTRRTRVDRIDLPWQVTTSTVGSGDGAPRAGPPEVDWWYASAQGRGRVTLSWRLPERGGDVVLADLDQRPGLRVDVTVALRLPGAFVLGIAMVVVGAGLVLLGWALLSTPGRPRGAHAIGADQPKRPT